MTKSNPRDATAKDVKKLRAEFRLLKLAVENESRYNGKEFKNIYQQLFDLSSSVSSLLTWLKKSREGKKK